MSAMQGNGWRPLSGPRPGAEAFVVSPFGRLARAHAMAVAGDTLVAIALAGTLFFSIDPAAARGRVFLYLALTMAPFAVVAPLVGPALDRSPGGRRWMIIAASALRALVCVLMVGQVDSLLLFPLAFLLLVLAKSHQVAKSALVPTVVRSDDELVEANSKLALISGLVGFAAAVPGGILLRFGGSEWALGLAAIVFAVGIAVSWRLPRVTVADRPESAEARAELRGAGVLLAVSAMGLLRGVVGFLAFMLAFSLRTDDAPTWHFGVVLGLSALGSLLGAALAPTLRRQTSEENIVTGLLVLVAVAAVASTWLGSLPGAALIAAAVGIGAAGAKQAFDAIVQRDAPDANRGRSFARFETRFQLTWVGGAVLGVIPMPMWLGFVVVGGTAAFAAISYTAGSRAARRDAERRPWRSRRRGGDETTIGTIPPYPPSIAAPGVDPTTTIEPTVVDPTIVERDR